jgi:hypothetical protein
LARITRGRLRGQATAYWRTIFSENRHSLFGIMR